MTNEAQLKVRKAQIADEQKAIESQLKDLRALKTFKCVGCDGRHEIRQCKVIQTHWYTEPHGCSGGDYWNEGELIIVCPTNGHGNRVLWNSPYLVPYDKRAWFDYNAEMQFKRLYKSLFKEVIDDHEKRHSNWTNTHCFDKHRATFDLHIEGLDPPKEEQQYVHQVG